MAPAEYAWWARNSQGQTHPVGQLKPNAWGLFDMYGNVYEWCADWHAADYYAKSPANDPTGADSGEYRVLRGGSWHDDDPGQLRSAYHHFSSPNARLITRRGFRVVRTVTP